ncbi:S8 family serine peptidase [bacterium]|nr:S8 family serine peptidase [bacterium]
MMMPISIIRGFCCCCLLWTATLHAQVQNQLGLPQTAFPLSDQRQPQIQFIQQPQGHRVNLFIARDGQSQIRTVDLTEVLNVIVEFKECPLFMQKNSRLPSAVTPVSFFRARFEQFSTDIQKTSQPQHQLGFAKPEIDRKFYKLFFGASLKVPRMMLQQIQNLDYVKQIHPDKKVETFLDESVPLIRADSVWSRYGTQGEAVIVGIIDTGIDYRHPALGGGLGPEFKVIGGDDVINRDANPLDDHGHGTYVAGIVAADGDSIKGVAPKARLMAFKVLDQNGIGLMSDVIAGIERALDPNDDDDFSDRVGIVNMSLGSGPFQPASPDDAVSLAVDNAVRLGVTVCIAAGNEGGFRSIRSPGTARLAITVGACDKSDRMASFSSKGPNAKTHSIKPEIVAPGVNIHSLSLNGGLVEASGTSAAAPHVAGVAALLKAIHPEWTPTQIKSALMTSAVDLGEEVMVQGAGRLDAFKAAETGVFATPAHLSFGLDNASLQEWVKSDTLIVINHSGILQNIDITFEGIETGIALESIPSDFALAPGDSQSLVITLKVMNQLVATPEEGSLAYSGYAHLNGTRDRLSLPWAFVKAAKVILSFDEPLPRFFFTSNKNVITNFDNVDMIDFYTYELVVAKGDYDLISLFSGADEKMVMKEKLAIDGFMNLSIRAEEATHRISLDGKDEQGRRLSSLSNVTNNYLFLFPDSSRNLYWGLLGYPDQLLVSNVSERYVIVSAQHQESIADEPSIRVVQHQPIRGLYQDRSLANSPVDFVMQHLKMKYPPNGSYRDIRFPSGFSAHIRGHAWFYYQDAGAIKPTRLQAPEWNGKLYQTPDAIENFRFTTSGIARDLPLSPETIREDWIAAGSYGVAADSMGRFFPRLRPADYLSPDGGEMSFGGAPVFGLVYHFNNQIGNANITADVEAFGSLNELRPADIARSRYDIYDDQHRLIASGELDDSSLLKVPPIDVTPGHYRLEISHTNYFVEGVRGRATFKTDFDLRREDPDPAFFTSLRLLDSQNLAVGRVENGDAAKLVFSAADVFVTKLGNSFHASYRPIIVDSTRLLLKEHGSDSWLQIESVPVLEDTTLSYVLIRRATGWLYTAELSAFTHFDSAALDLKISIQDQSGNVTELILEPAFAVGKFGTVVSVEEQPSDENSLPLAYRLYPSHPNPFNPSTVITFDLPRTGRVMLKIYDVLGRVVETLLDELVPAGRHKITWNAAGPNHRLLASGVYICRMEAENYTATRKLLLLR